MNGLIGIKPKTCGLYLDQLYLKRIDDQIHLAEKNLWILTEERPKREVIQQIIELVTKKPYEIKTIKPIICCKKFDGTYEVIGIKTEFPKIIIELVSGTSGKETGSFVDFLIFQQEDSPIPEKKREANPCH